LRALVEPGHVELSVRRQCELLGLPRANYYYEPAPQTEENLRLMGLIDRQYLDTPCYGSRRMTAWLRRQGEAVNRKRVQRLMQVMGIEAIYPKPKLSVPGANHKVYPYLLRGVPIERADQVWSSDITYVGLPTGFMYLCCVIDWYSRYVLAWELSNTLDGDFCLACLEAALRKGSPEVFNTDQGCQFTAWAFVERVQGSGAQMSMDGKGRCLDNVFVERLWRTVKHEYLYLHRHESVPRLRAGLSGFFPFYNEERLHQSLDYLTPAEVYRAGRRAA
jgi:putative transposase